MEAKKARKNPSHFLSIVSTFIMCYILWILFTWSLNVRELVIGALVCALVAVLSARMLIHEQAFYLYNPKRFFLFLYYIFVVLIGEIIKANFDLAKRVFKREMPINPGIIRIPAQVDSEYGLAFLSNAITLTPGTITVEAASDGERDFLYVHWIDVQTTDREEAGRMIKARLEKWIRRI